MSSHHIIREKQEPALLVLGLRHFDDELLGQLLEWSPTVIVTPTTAESLDSMGIKIDMVVGGEVQPSALQSDLKYIPAINESLVEAALKYLVTHNYPAVNIIADEFSLKDYLYYTDKINMVVFHDHQKIYPITSGFSKWKPAGEYISIINHTAIVTSGLAQTGDDRFITTHDGFFTIQFNQPIVFIAESII